MGEVGVMAVVEGLSSFVSDMGKVQSSIEQITPSTSILQDAFTALGNTASQFASWVGDVLAYTLGGLLKDAIEGVISVIGDLINKTIEAGNEFQTLTLRLNGINLDTAMKSGKDYNTAMAESIQLTKEQLDWLQLLAMSTPYDNTDISNTYTMARTYGFADEQARALTEDVANLTAGMGLEKASMIEIIRNLGQMAAKGKITGREMTDLANRQVPIADILQRIVDRTNESNKGFVDNSGAIAAYNSKLETLRDKLAIAIQKSKEFTDRTKESTRMANALTIENLRKQIDGVSATIGGLANQEKKLMTVADLMKQISKPGGGVDYQLFIDAFQEMTDEEARFSGASERMARTFKAATDNVQDLLTSFGGLNVVAPVLDVIGGKIADFMDNFSTKTEAGRAYTELGTRLRQAFLDVGTAIADITSKLLGLGPSSKDLASGLVTGLEGVAKWLNENKDGIVTKVREIIQGFMNFLGPINEVNNACQTGLIPTLRSLYDSLFKVRPGDQITDWQLLKSAIEELGKAIGEVFQPIIDALGLDKMPKFSFSVRDLVENLYKLTAWIKENQGWLTILLVIIGSFIILQTISNLWLSLIIALISFGVTVVTVVAGVLSLIAAFVFFKVIIDTAIMAWRLFQIACTNAVIGIQFGITVLLGLFWNMQNTLTEIFNNVMVKIKTLDWWGVGWAIISGIANGIKNNVSIVAGAAMDAATAAYNAAMTLLKAHSPSLLFEEVGSNIMAGMAQGIVNSAGLAVSAMQNAVSAVSMPAMQMPAVTQQYSQAAPRSISNTYQSNNAYNLTVNGAGDQESIVQDFNMLQSLAGA